MGHCTVPARVALGDMIEALVSAGVSTDAEGSAMIDKLPKNDVWNIHASIDSDDALDHCSTSSIEATLEGRRDACSPLEALAVGDIAEGLDEIFRGDARIGKAILLRAFEGVDDIRPIERVLGL